MKKAIKSETQLVTVGFDRDVHKRLRILSVERRVTMAELIRISVDEWLRRAGPRRRQRRIEPGRRYLSAPA